MKVGIRGKNDPQDWEGKIGLSRETIIEKLLASEWHTDVLPESTLVISQGTGCQFNLKLEDPERMMTP